MSKTKAQRLARLDGPKLATLKALKKSQPY